SAVDKMQIDPTRLQSTPIQLTFEDLNRISPMSLMARRWLGDATISITAKEVTYPVWRNRQWEVNTFPYLTTVHLKHEWDCSVAGPDSLDYSCTSPSGTWGLCSDRKIDSETSRSLDREKFYGPVDFGALHSIYEWR